MDIDIPSSQIIHLHAAKSYYTTSTLVYIYNIENYLERSHSCFSFLDLQKKISIDQSHFCYHFVL